MKIAIEKVGQGTLWVCTSRAVKNDVILTLHYSIDESNEEGQKDVHYYDYYDYRRSHSVTLGMVSRAQRLSGQRATRPTHGLLKAIGAAGHRHKMQRMVGCWWC